MTKRKQSSDEHRAQKYALPDSGKLVSYARYRKITDHCETCGSLMKSHPTCDGCGALCGSMHLEPLPTPYRGYDLCPHCIGFWEALDRVKGRKTKWIELMHYDKKRAKGVIPVKK